MPPKKIGNELVWSNDEAELLLKVENKYKVSKSAESIDCESVKTKHSDIFELFIATLPHDDYDVQKSFLHTKDKSTSLFSIMVFQVHTYFSCRPRLLEYIFSIYTAFCLCFVH